MVSKCVHLALKTVFRSISIDIESAEILQKLSSRLPDVQTNIDVSKIDVFQTDSPVILLPSHKSYFDFLIISYICFTLKVRLPMVAAGKIRFTDHFRRQSLRFIGLRILSVTGIRGFLSATAWQKLARANRYSQNLFQPEFTISLLGTILCRRLPQPNRIHFSSQERPTPLRFRAYEK